MDDEERTKQGAKFKRDYYFEDGLMVMTEAYHLKRGYCCSNDCRHCPYPKEKSMNSGLSE